jgi:exodeoxyribonuclease VII small subunit
MAMKKNEAASETFEVAMERLEQITRQLESGDVPLEQAIELFQEGMHLSQVCSTKLQSAERTIQKLMENENGKPVTVPLVGAAQLPDEEQLLF